MSSMDRYCKSTFASDKHFFCSVIIFLAQVCQYKIQWKWMKYSLVSCKESLLNVLPCANKSLFTVNRFPGIDNRIFTIRWIQIRTLYFFHWRIQRRGCPRIFHFSGVGSGVGGGIQCLFWVILQCDPDFQTHACITSMETLLLQNLAK